MEQSQSNSMIDSAFCAIKWAHDMAGVPSPTDNPAVEAVRLASMRIPGTATVNRKEPISCDIIQKKPLATLIWITRLIYGLFLCMFCVLLPLLVLMAFLE